MEVSRAPVRTTARPSGVVRTISIGPSIVTAPGEPGAASPSRITTSCPESCKNQAASSLVASIPGPETLPDHDDQPKDPHP